MTVARTRAPGRPSVTDHATIERAAFDLFAKHGFGDTTMDEIAQAVGVGKRTLFRYFPSKNDIPWGQFGESLLHFRAQLASQPQDLTIADAVHRCVVSFNDFTDDAVEQHRFRMKLILTTPALQAHSALRYAAWRDVIAAFVAERTGQETHDLLPRTVGHVSLALAVTSYEQWLAHPDLHLTDVLDESLAALKTYLTDSGDRRSSAVPGDDVG